VFGEFPSRRVRVEPPPGVAVATDERVVLVLHDETEVRGFGSLIAGPTLEAGVFSMRELGIVPELDHSAPMSLSQLLKYMQTGRLEQRFSIRVTFPHDTGTRQWSADHTVVSDSGQYYLERPTNFCLLDFDSNPPLGLVTLLLDLDGNCSTTGPHRTLELGGTITGLDEAGAILVDVIPTAPFLHQTEYEHLLADPSASTDGNVVSIDIEGRAWAWHFTDALVDADGIVHDLAESGGERETIDDGARVRWRFEYKYGDIELTLDTVVDAKETVVHLLSLIAGGRVTCTLFDGSRPRPCELGSIRAIFLYEG
jgi:hypothetical protein